MMPLFVIGILLLIIAIVGSKSNEAIYRAKGLMMLGAVVLMIIGIGTASVKQIEAGEIGVQLLFGKVQDETLGEGLNFILPVMDVETISIKTRNYTMSSGADEQSTFQGDPVRVLSADGLEVSIDVTVLYRVVREKAPELRRTVGFDFESRVVRPQTRTRIRENAVQYDAVDLYSSKREEFQANIRENIAQDFLNRGLFLEDLLVRNIQLPETVRKSIERKLTADQEAQRMEFVKQKAEQEADIRRVEAKGVADAQRIINEGLTDKVLQYELIKVQKDLAESQNSKIIIMGGGKNNMPLILNDR